MICVYLISHHSPYLYIHHGRSNGRSKGAATRIRALAPEKIRLHIRALIFFLFALNIFQYNVSCEKYIKRYCVQLKYAK